MKLKLISNPPGIVSERGQMLNLGCVEIAKAFGWAQREPNQFEDAMRFIQCNEGVEVEASGRFGE